jgi:hypothetical protein
LNHNYQQNKPAFVLGNGQSRSVLKLSNLKSHATVYACNAMYRDYDPDYLIAVDVKMIQEIVKSGYNKKHQVWTNPNKGVVTYPDLYFFHPHKGWSSGPTALFFAAQKGHSEIYIFGFDFVGVDGKFNNVYANTANYKKSTDTATFFGNWLRQTCDTVYEFKNTQFYRVINETDHVPDIMKKYSNLHNITYYDFSKKFPDCI